MNKQTKKLALIVAVLIICAFVFATSGTSNEEKQEANTPVKEQSQTPQKQEKAKQNSNSLEAQIDRLAVTSTAVDVDEIPEYSYEPYVVINANQPSFNMQQVTATPFEYYGDLDSLGRCTVTVACVGEETEPTTSRGSISEVKPTGWVQNRYEFVDGESLYNRCHLIGYQLTGENANWQNIITGTRYMNVDGMLPFEDIVDDYVDDTGNHVIFRVTPIFDGNDLVARGVQMEAYSVEDNGRGVCFNVFCYNVQPGVIIDYRTGENWAA